MSESYERDLYDILQVSPTAEPEVIQAAYKRLARKYHPDVNLDSFAKERMQELNWAYEILSDPDKRRDYDLKRSSDGQNNSPSSRPKEYRHKSQESSQTIDEITQEAINKHRKKVEWSEKISSKTKLLSNLLDPIVREVLKEIGDAQSKWLRGTNKTPDIGYETQNQKQPWGKSSYFGIAVDLLGFVLSETLGKYSYTIKGNYDSNSSGRLYIWQLKWDRFSDVGYAVILQVDEIDGTTSLDIEWKYNSSFIRDKKSSSVIFDTDRMTLTEIKGQVRDQILSEYKRQIRA